MLPPGRLKLVTKPYFSGSRLVANTIGMVEVAALAARTATGEPVATITAGRSLINSTAAAGKRPLLLAERNSNLTFLPSTKPASARPWRNASEFGGFPKDRNPPGGIGCCARAPRGPPAPAP